jgi:hypothetical protein
MIPQGLRKSLPVRRSRYQLRLACLSNSDRAQLQQGFPLEVMLIGLPVMEKLIGVSRAVGGNADGTEGEQRD